MTKEEYAQTTYQAPVYGDSNAVTAPEPSDHGVDASGHLHAEDPSIGSTKEFGYESFTNGSVPTDNAGLQSSDNAMTSVDETSGVSAEDRLWSIVKTNSLDFDAWTALIDETERMAGEKIWKIRKVYDEFLAEFPLCYGYWKKYADHEARLGSMDKVVEVYERAVLGVTYSVDIWVHYCSFCISTYVDPDAIRRLFERALEYVGTDYMCFPIWDKYIEYEEMQLEWARVAILYSRVLEIPNRRLDDYLLRFKNLAASRPLSELKTPEEVIALADDTRKPEEQDIKTEKRPSESKVVEAVSGGISESVEFEKYLALREDIHRKTKEDDARICDFENGIRRPYFHVRPLNVTELGNWHNYLSFIEQEGDLNKIVKLYERCLIACANYHEYWIRYVLCMEAYGNLEIANNALSRATQVFVKRQPEIHLFAARLREKSGDIDGARASYQLIHTTIAPGLLDAIVKHANLEHRVENDRDAFTLYEQAITIEKGKENSPTLPILYAQYTRFLLLVCGNSEKAVEVLSEAVENSHLSKPLLEAIIHFETIQPHPKRIDYVDSLMDKFLAATSDNIYVSFADREELSSVYLEFLDLFGDAQAIIKAEDRHTKFFLPHRSRTEVRKRHADDFLASDKLKLAKSYGDNAAQSQWSGYAAQPQGWAAAYGQQPYGYAAQTTATTAPQAAYGYGSNAYYGSYY